ncbi:hypothetical protein ASE86_03380 [Sphingomonas sp. Leaf33]|uniref:hypothetical protein n=1 Tax=Sphingomonas sp. Leaf33 TaxID=1736215 RepID=UPI0006F6449E|nr:hypothetical protein [Sphingomonas sp. Leaf33]KQN25299.1 hypothetical protein ASE86_03380 [Sphingomonas sp. Leaf33]
MKKTLAAAAIVLTAAPMSGSGAAATPQAASGVEMAAFPLDVAGVRLGMSASEARAALVKAGYAMPATNGVSYGPSLAARVRAEAARRRTGSATSPAMSDRVMTQLQGVGPNRASITVGLTATPAGGSTVTSVFLTMPQEVMKGDAFLRQVVAKYGKPDGSRDQGMTPAWCSAPLKSVCGTSTPFQRRPEALPNLKASVVYNDNTIRLQDGAEQDRERERTFAATVDGAAPKTDRAAF